MRSVILARHGVFDFRLLRYLVAERGHGDGESVDFSSSSENLGWRSALDFLPSFLLVRKLMMRRVVYGKHKDRVYDIELMNSKARFKNWILLTTFQNDIRYQLPQVKSNVDADSSPYLCADETSYLFFSIKSTNNLRQWGR